MIGFILKDILIMKKYMRSVFISLLFCITIFAFTSGVQFIAGIIPVFLAMFVISTFSYDELAKWDRYALTMPAKRSDIVLSKYILCILLSAVGAIISLILCYIILLIQGKPITAEFLLSIPVSSLVALLLNTFMLPLYFKYGAEKARMFFMLLIIISVGSISVLHSLGISTPNDKNILILMKVSPLIIALIFALSFFISLKIYKKKEC